MPSVMWGYIDGQVLDHWCNLGVGHYPYNKIIDTLRLVTLHATTL